MQQGDEICEPRDIEEGGMGRMACALRISRTEEFVPLPEGSVWVNSRQKQHCSI
jgi:hypothetical protein